MNKLLLLLLLLPIIFVGQITAQSGQIKQLEKQLSKAKRESERMELHYQIAELYLSKNSKNAERHAYQAALKAVETKDYEMAAKAYYLNAQAKEKNRDKKGAYVRYKTSFGYAKSAGDIGLGLDASKKLINIAKKNREYRQALGHSQAMVALLKDSGRGGSSNSKANEYKGRIGRHISALEKEKESLEKDIKALQREKSRFNSTKKNLTNRQKELEKEKERIQEEFAEQEVLIDEMSEKESKDELKIYRQRSQLKEFENQSIKDSLAIAHQEAAIQQADLALSESKLQKSYLFLALGLILAIALILFLGNRSNRRANKVLAEKNKIIEEERKRSEDLLLNILPAPIAQELKENGKAKARSYENASVLFTDFKNFSKISEQLTPEQLVEELDYCFKGFDYIVTQNKLEKIKTIGDAYMCVHGLTGRAGLPVGMIKAALEMQEFLTDHKKEKIAKGLPYFEARIGIHTGPVVAGVVGFNKFAYDIWGDTVNIAARMESNCEVGHVNISESTFRMIKYNFECRYRGKIKAKNKGEIDMYYVNKAIGN